MKHLRNGNASGKPGPRMCWYFLPRGLVGLGLCLDSEYLRHGSQFKINFSCWSFKPGQYTVSLVLSLHLRRPKCPLCMSRSVAWHFLCGTTFWVPIKTIPSLMVSSLLKVQYVCISLGISLMLLDHQCIMVCFSSASSLSSWVAILIWLKLSLLALRWLVIRWICSLGSLMASFCPPSQDKQSANWFVLPGIYFTVKWYAKVLFSILYNLGVVWLILLDNMISIGFWSVSSRKWLAYREWWNFSIAQTTERDSNSITT